ncbi:LOW QUALITY PROTEIN: zinc finger B-box domain-containing protein 1 [Sorex araneus]|uniref:LOW QUALITY PROTEIN: zinc finger B-box domain-containing protein 1 n=1 Tax=Sorex araneus TaxID=42254 RepID=UPI0024339536|nr:LOW QUALITY PROTEIN: zinc finger B-box domain-containing protein 1 [Sorex araneus]
MNTKDFIVLPWGKPGNSVKLKHKNSQDLKMEKVQLELENQEMEKTLLKFQSTRSKEKEERQSSGYYWKSGQMTKLENQSHLISQNKGNVKLSAGKVKLKLLKEQLQEPMKQLSHKVTSTSQSEKSLIKGKDCGQCEIKAALLICLECGEDYCSDCFAKIHQKGALKLHRVSPLQEKSQILFNVIDAAHQFIKEDNRNECKRHHFGNEISKNDHKAESLLLQGMNSEVKVSTAIDTGYKNPKERLLCEESFDEEAAAESVQESLHHWITVQHDEDKKPNLQVTKPESQEVCEVQTDLKIWREPLEIKFKEDSLSYMEKLWLKKYRRTPQEKLQNMIPDTFITPCKSTSETQCSHNENNENSNVERKKMQHQASFLPAEELKIERSEPALKIIELNDTSEEEFEETGNIVPYKVELADTDCQQSYTFHDSRNTFLHENDILFRHIFVKTDLLHLHLSSRFSYCKDYPKVSPNTWHGFSLFCQQEFTRRMLRYPTTVYPDVFFSPAIIKIEKNELFERNIEDKCISIIENQSSDDSHILNERKDFLQDTSLTKPSVREKLPKDTKESLTFSDIYERPSFEESKTTESPLLLQKLYPRSKSVIEHQGAEIFIDFDKNERLNLFPSHSLEYSYSSTRITTAGDRKWFPDHSISTYADNAVALDAFQSAQSPSSSRTQKKMSEINQKAAIP